MSIQKAPRRFDPALAQVSVESTDPGEPALPLPAAAYADLPGKEEAPRLLCGRLALGALPLDGPATEASLACTTSGAMGSSTHSQTQTAQRHRA